MCVWKSEAFSFDSSWFVKSSRNGAGGARGRGRRIFPYVQQIPKRGFNTEDDFTRSSIHIRALQKGQLTFILGKI